jgi:general secretion pathway protein G
MSQEGSRNTGVVVVLTVRQALTSDGVDAEAAAGLDERIAACSKNISKRKMLEGIKTVLASRNELEFYKRVLLAVMLPQLDEAEYDSRESQLKSDLQTVRSQLELYKVQHLDVYPAAGEGQTGVDLVAQLTRTTNVEGKWGDAANPRPTLGPYLIRIPTNPFATANEDKIEVGRRQNADGDPGWFFNPETGEFRANDPEHSDL